MQFRLLKHRLKLITCNVYLKRNFSALKPNEESLKEHIRSPLERLPQCTVYEPFWYSFWEQSELFKAGIHKPNDESGIKDRFSIILPPPNITGDLHLGHALTVCIQDSIFRYNKMMNHSRDCVWIPGFDHAGIATHLIVDKLCYASKGKRAHQLSRRELYKIANEWKEKRIQSIRDQLKILGASLDFSKEFFTLNENLSDSVNEAFIRLFEMGLIYREKMMVNWSFYLNSTISDIEMVWKHIDKPTFIEIPGFEDKVEFGFLYKFAYPVVDSKDGEEIVVATTRIESILSDVAVAVHPSDERYSRFIGRQLLHPLTGHKLKVIADERADPNFCTGAVKITPTESEMDFAVAKDHNLTGRSSIDEKGLISFQNIKREYSFLNGLHRYSAKLKIIEILCKLGYYRGKVEHKTKIPLCSRSGDVIEKRILPQWFLKHQPVGNEIKELIENNTIEIIPERQKVRLINWINNDNDWCISRQIFWGHRIPAFNVFAHEKIYGCVVAKSEDEAFKKAEEQYNLRRSDFTLIQEKDVLDTWFSSALLPFSVLGWPNVTSKDFKSYYPLNLMETGSDILNFWVLRMLMLGKYLTNQLPFTKIILHGMICDATGKKMTKSLGNVIDPKDVINGITLEKLKQKTTEYKNEGILDESKFEAAIENQQKLFPEGIAPCSADSLRMSLFEVKDETNDSLRLSVQKILSNRNYVNKMWQTFNFFNLMLEKKPSSHEWVRSVNSLETLHQLSNMDKWILSRLANFIETCHESIDSANFAKIHSAINTFWIQNLCDFYVESLKLTFYAERRDEESISRCLNVLSICLKSALTAMHPFMPFVTEELFQRLKFSTNDLSEQTRSILLEEYPKNEVWSKFRNTEHENIMTVVYDIIHNIRMIKTRFLASVDEEKELSVNIIAEPEVLRKITLFSDIFPKFTRSQFSFVSSEHTSSNEWVYVNINESITLAVQPSVHLVTKKLNSTLEKQQKLKEKLDILETKPKSRNKEIKVWINSLRPILTESFKKQQILDKLSTLQIEENDLRRILQKYEGNNLKENKL